MKPYDVVGYTADADSYCPPCASTIYGDGISGENGIQDHEGNLVAPIFADSEWDYPVSCGKCHEYIDTHLTNDGITYALNLVVESINENSVTNFMMEVCDSLLWMGLTESDRNLVLTCVDIGSKGKK